jgi:tetratricopeptide (TPR) repeat protein
MSDFRKAIGFGFIASVMLAGGILFCPGWVWPAQTRTSTPIGGSGSPRPSTGNSAPAQPSTGGRPLSPYRISVTDLDSTLSKLDGEKQQLSSLPPFTEKQLIKLIKHHKKNLSKAVPAVEARGLAFDITPKIEAELRNAGADENFIAAIKGYTPSARASVSADVLVAESGATPAEAKAYNELVSQKDTDKRIRDANTFAQKFPKSTLLSYVYAVQAAAYWEKNDASNVVNYCERSLALDAHNLMALLLASSTLPQPQMLAKISDVEKQKRLELAETYARKALQRLDRMGKDQMAGGVYASLGMVYLERSRMTGQQPDTAELGKAEQSYKMAIEKSQGSGNAANYFRLGDIYSLENKLDDAIAAYSQAKQLAPGSIIEERADRHIKSLQEEKLRAKAP